MDILLSPLTIAWSMCAASCMALGLILMLLWTHDWRRLDYLLAAAMAVAGGCSALTEMGLAFAGDIPTYIELMKIQVPLAFIIVMSLVWFVYIDLGTASRSLALAITALWIIHLTIHLMSPSSGVYAEIASLDQIRSPWGETFAVPRGTVHPWRFIVDVAVLLTLVYLVQATIRAWRDGDRERAALIGGSSAVFIILGGVHSFLVDSGRLAMPYLISVSFLWIVAAMSYQLVGEVLKAGRYARVLEARDKRWHELLEKLPLLVVRRDPAGNIEYVNPALLAATGHSAQELHGTHFSRLVPEAEADRALARFDRVLRESVGHPQVFSLTAIDGKVREILWSTVVLRDENAQPVGVLSIGLDLTDQLQTRSDLAQARHEMELMSRLTLLGEVAAGLAHELNQPLAAILSNVQAARRMLATDSPTDLQELREIMDDVIAEDKRAGQVVHGLRAMLRSSETMDGRASLGKVVSAGAELMAGELRAEGTRLSIDLEDEFDVVSAEPIQAQLVVMNLILNAKHASRLLPPGRREVVIRSRAVNGEIVVSVADRGMGIDPDTMKNMFEPFMTTRKAGLGMGLAICRRIVEGCGGRIWAENRAGGGATVYFSLPRVDGQQQVGA